MASINSNKPCTSEFSTYSDESMLTRIDIIILMQQVDVTKAYDLLAMFKEAGKERIDIRTILDEVAQRAITLVCCSR